MTTDSGSSSAVRLDAVKLGRDWMRTPAGVRVMRDMPTYRALGLVKAHTPHGALDGVLIRHIRHKSYRMVADERVVDLDTEATDAFLKVHRKGHHGGPGRAQGPLAKDGRAYTRRYTVSIPASAVEAIVDRGDGVMSLGLRHLAANMARRMRERPESIPAPAVLLEKMRAAGEDDGGLIAPRVYLDVESHEVLKSLGGGNLSRGIRFAVWLSAHRIR